MDNFKDISDYLGNLYPNTNVFVISDEHFYHNNIIKYTRNNFHNIYEMNNHIINKHNSIVSNNDIVIFLGDFSFKKGEISNILSKLNGHKFLILGNHDDKKLLSNYKKLGFENVFVYPVKIDNNILSHYPILNSPKEVIYDIFKKEFNNRDYTNYYGHEHYYLENGYTYNKSLNVTCENLDYTPLLIGKTKDKTKYNESIIENKDFNKTIDFVSSKVQIKKEIILKDLIYLMMINSINDEKDVCFYGSYMLFKKYGLLDNFSDLDSTVIYDKNLSIKKNSDNLSRISNKVYTSIKDIPQFNINYHKKIGNLAILHNLYGNGIDSYINLYLDMNVIMNNIYRDSDFINIDTKSIIENVCNRYNYDIDSKLPRCSVKTLNINGDITNLILQYLYQPLDNETKCKLLKRIRYIVKNNKIDSFNDIESYMIRYLIRNILFFDKTNRYNEIDYILRKENFDIDELPLSIKSLIEVMLYDNLSDYKNVYEYLSKYNSKDAGNACNEVLNEENKKILVKNS